jgi:hypothetical protein
MTLPFRRRHHDAEATHDRARSLWSDAMLEPLESADVAWLERHLDACAECRLDHERYVADRDLLRSLRVAPPEPPRDLWARTAAAIEQESGRGARAAGGPFRRLPVGAASGLLVVLVVIGAAVVSRETPIGPLPSARTSAPVGSVEPAATPLEVIADDVRWIRPRVDGTYEVVVAGVQEVCTDPRIGCPELQQTVEAPIKLGGRPVGVTVSPVRDDEIVVISAGDDNQPARVIVIAVPETTPIPTETSAPVTPATTEEPTVLPTPSTSETPEATPTATLPATPTAAPTEPGPEATPEGIREIARGVIVIGDAVYSHDGQWLAFSARPSDGSTGPDLYIWRAGSEAAVAVTDDHRTYFSSWLGDRILASRVELTAPAEPPTAEPSAEPTPGTLEEPGPASSAVPSDAATPEPDVEGRPVSFLLDPATLTVTELAEPDVWLPVVDPSGRLVVYWSGTVAPDVDGLDWHPAAGRLVLDRWSGVEGEPVESEAPSSAPTEPAVTEPAETEPAETGPAATEPAETAAAPSVGPAGEPVVLVEGPIAAFDARFDPDGLHLGLWTLERADADHGRLQLLVLDPEAARIDETVKPLQGVPALRGFSIKAGRLAWVTPPGQDGRQSSVAVLAWKDNDFGHVETIQAQELLVLR